LKPTAAVIGVRCGVRSAEIVETQKWRRHMINRKRVEGKVEFNDGEFAEVLTYGIEGIEKDLMLETIQIHCEDIEDTPEEFQQRFPVGMRLSIVTSTEITAI
jgi:hypothetical protein